MRYSILILLLASCLFAQVEVKPNKSYTFSEGMVAFTVEEFEKLDSLLDEADKMKLKIGLLEEKVETMDTIELKLNDQVSNLQGQLSLKTDKLELASEREALLNQKVGVYKDLFEDLNKELDNRKGKRGLGGTFWFGTGTVAGAIIIYLSSMIVSNVN